MELTRHPDVVAAHGRYERSLKLEERLTERIEAAEQAVARWQWFTTDLHAQPHLAERLGSPVPVPLDAPPKRPRARRGLSADGQPLLVLSCDDEAGHVYGDLGGGRVEILEFNPLHAVQAALVQRSEGGQVVSTAWASYGLRALETYTRDEAGRVTRIDGEYLDADGRRTSRDDLTWEGERLVRIEQRDARGRVVGVPFEAKGRASGSPKAPKPAKAPKPPSVDALAAQVEARLVEVVPAAVRRAKVRGRVAALALCYCYDAGCFPPDLGLLLERERDAWRADGDDEREWAPPEWKLFETRALALKDPALGEACAALAERLRERDSSPIVPRVYQRVVAALAKERWGDGLEITDDFLVFAVDTEQQDLARNLRATLPAKRFAALRPRLP